MRFGADWRRVPDEFIMTLGGITPRWLLAGKAFLDLALGFAQQHWDVLLRVQAIADKERDDDDVLRLREFVAVGNARLLFEKNRVHGGVFVRCANDLHL